MSGRLHVAMESKASPVGEFLFFLSSAIPYLSPSAPAANLS